MAAIIVAIFVTRLLRLTQVQTQRQIAALQASRLQEAERREAWRGELFKRVVAAQEAERQRIARELHDETGQALTAIGLGLRGASATLRQDPDRAVGNLRKLEDLVARAIDELQRVIADLRPSHLDDLGLPAALRWYASELQARTHLSVSVEVLGEPWPIGPTANTALFRVTQEALTNVARHAEATVAIVFLEYEPDRVRLRVDDNGKGFDPSVIANPDRVSWGLLGIEERASLLGGKMVLRSQAGRGTSLEVNIPRSGEVRVDDDHTPVAG
jgi:signal transduction histidine kinase